MIPQFDTIAEKFAWVRENKALLMQAKKATVKHADGVFCDMVGETAKHAAVAKEIGGSVAAPVTTAGLLYVKSIINTTNLLDSHLDVHIPGLWKKSLAEAKQVYLLQEHKMQFDKVIADDVTAYPKSVSWKSLGYAYEGSTQALVFDSTVKAGRNPFMFEQYASGYVKNHSVGMRYVKMYFCVNSTDKWFLDEKENWDKYISMVANKDAAEAEGMFWAVTEAQVVEGSAVLVGSNGATPTMSVSEAGFKATPAEIEPAQATQPDYSFLKHYKF